MLANTETGEHVRVRETIIPQADIASKETSKKSLMPEGLLETLTDREQLELLKFLTSH